jgi:uncharacterized membrane protein YagU involved in acid resistance
MGILNNTNSKFRVAPFSTIIKAGLLAGALDICFAFLYSYIKRGTDPATVLQYISKIALGKTAFTDPVVSTISGLLIHFTIAMAWTILFFILYRWLNLIRLNKIVTGILYGLIVWAMMSIVILPLWNNRSFVLNFESASINALILIAAIGLPLSFIAHHYYSKKNNSNL